jgi:inner membrane protein
MMAPTHFMFALALAYVLRLPRVPTAIAGIIPDIDFVLHYGFPFMHRGIIHTPLIMLTIMLALYAVTRNIPLTAGFGVGFLGHMLTDLITPTGIMFFYPWPYFMSFNLAYYDSVFANLGIITLSLSAILLYNSKWFRNQVSTRFDINLGVNR